MNPRSVLAMLVRVTSVFILVAVVGTRWPGLLVRPILPLVRGLVEVTSPYLDIQSVRVTGATVQICGELKPRMTLRDGAPLSATTGTWNKQAGPTVNLVVVALAVWMAPARTWRHRVRALAVTLPAAVLVCGFQLAVEIQESALRHLGESWLPQQALAGTAENLAYFRNLETRFRLVQWIKSLLDGGGALFLAVLAGLSGHAWPVDTTRRGPPQGDGRRPNQTKGRFGAALQRGVKRLCFSPLGA